MGLFKHVIDFPPVKAFAVGIAGHLEPVLY